MNPIKRLFYQVKEGIENLIVWFPIIWKDRDFDYNYLLYIIIFKTKNMVSFFESKYSITDWKEEHSKKDLNALKRVIPLLEYIRDEKYEDDAFKEHWEKFPAKLEFIENKDNTKPYKTLKPMSEKEMKSFKEAWLLSEINYKKAMREMGKLITTHFKGWWD